MTTTSEILSNGLSEIMASWASRHGGERDPFYWMLRLQVARASGTDGAELARVPGEFRAELASRHAAIGGYWDNVRYALLDPLATIWGTVVNALRVATNVPTVTPEQRRTFEVPLESLATFVRSAHESAACEALYQAFRPMPAPDCQALAALFHPSARIDAHGIAGLMRMLSTEGPVTAAESEALSVLTASGLAQHAFRGVRRDG